VGVPDRFGHTLRPGAKALSDHGVERLAGDESLQDSRGVSLAEDRVIQVDEAGGKRIRSSCDHSPLVQ
jgi:hypothetical protein